MLNFSQIQRWFNRLAGILIVLAVLASCSTTNDKEMEYSPCVSVKDKAANQLRVSYREKNRNLILDCPEQKNSLAFIDLEVYELF